MPRKLTDWDLRTIADVTSAHAQALAFARAAQVDADFRARLAEAARRIEARRGMTMPRRLLMPIAPLFRDLEREAEVILRREG
jgi:hypothetical protein